MKVYFILPAYNEGSGIRLQLRALEKIMKEKRLEFEIVIINDGSLDETEQEAALLKPDLNIHIIRHPVNLGPGRAFKSGYNYVYTKITDDDVVITMDCDNTQNLKTVTFMLNKIEEGYEVIVGSIFTPGGMGIGIPFFRLLMTFAANWIYRILFPIRGITDYTAFYRAVRGSALKMAYDKFGERLIESKGFSCMAEMLLKFRQIPLFMTEVPMMVRYDLKTSKSKLKIIPTIREHLLSIAKNFFKRSLI